MNLRLIDSDPQGSPDRYIPSQVWHDLKAAGEDPRHHAPLKWGYPRDGVFTVADHPEPPDKRGFIWLNDHEAVDALELYWGL